jgi:hypothetical protein
MFYALVKERKVPLWIVLPALALIPLAGLALALMLFGVALGKITFLFTGAPGFVRLCLSLAGVGMLVVALMAGYNLFRNFQSSYRQRTTAG